MHAILFELKRAFQSSQKYTRDLFAKFELTSARFDMLFAINHQRELSQAGLARFLGIKGSTVSQMLLRLERLGLIKRRRCPWDKRIKLVSLTEKGRACIVRATRVLINRGFAGMVVLELIEGKARRWRPFTKLPEEFWTIAELDTALNRIRRVSKDFAKLHYPWHPDD